jgi:ATP-dependent DNA helicase RecG
MPPTFESSREKNTFTVRLLLHHLLNEEDIYWLNNFKEYDLNDNQKRILVFVREVNAIDNSAARQINGSDVLTANIDLRELREHDLLVQKGKSKFTYYIASDKLKSFINNAKEDLSASVKDLSAPVKDLSAPVDILSALVDDIPESIRKQINNLGKRTNDKEKISSIILQLCTYKPMKSKALANVIGKSEKYILRDFIKPLLNAKKINYTIPEMINHPEQAYTIVEKVEEKR